jgi:hypothetical protein
MICRRGLSASSSNNSWRAQIRRLVGDDGASPIISRRACWHGAQFPLPVKAPLAEFQKARGSARAPFGFMICGACCQGAAPASRSSHPLWSSSSVMNSVVSSQPARCRQNLAKSVWSAALCCAAGGGFCSQCHAPSIDGAKVNPQEVGFTNAASGCRLSASIEEAVLPHWPGSISSRLPRPNCSCKANCRADAAQRQNLPEFYSVKRPASQQSDKRFVPGRRSHAGRAGWVSKHAAGTAPSWVVHSKNAEGLLFAVQEVAQQLLSFLKLSVTSLSLWTEPVLT